MKYIKLAWIALSCVFLYSCASGVGVVNSGKSLSDANSWYVSPAQNTSQYIYGVGEGRNLEEATKSALSDASARLSVTISSNSTTLLEENRSDVNEEFRKQINQNIEKIQFPNFKVTNSSQKGVDYYVEVRINRVEFNDIQKERVEFLDNQINNLNNSISSQNIIQKRSSYNKIIELGKESEMLTRIIYSSRGGMLKKKLRVISDAKYSLSKLNNKFEFYFIAKGDSAIYNVVKKYLNKEGVAISGVKTNLDNQIVMDVTSKSTSGKVYNSFITKIKINFKNISDNRTVASNDIEVAGSSVISRNESYDSALESFDEMIEKDGIFSVLGVE